MAKAVKSPYSKKVKRTSSGEVYMKVNAEKQKGETCNPTSMAMILDYYGIYVSSRKLQKDSVDDDYKYSSYLREQAKKYKMQMLFLPMLKDKPEVTYEAIIRAIDSGVPLQWLINMLKAPDYDVSKKHKKYIRKNGGNDGHARVFHGYKKNRRNGKLEYFIFSDSWGMKHRKKEIMIADVPAMTRGFFIVIPDTAPKELIEYIYEPYHKLQ